jgi:hypothetical protein
MKFLSNKSQQRVTVMQILKKLKYMPWYETIHRENLETRKCIYNAELCKMTQKCAIMWAKRDPRKINEQYFNCITIITIIIIIIVEMNKRIRLLRHYILNLIKNIFMKMFHFPYHW